MTEASLPSLDVHATHTTDSPLLRWLEGALSPDRETRARLRRAARGAEPHSLDTLASLATVAGARASISEVRLCDAVARATATEPLVIESPTRGLVSLHGTRWLGALVRLGDEPEPRRMA